MNINQIRYFLAIVKSKSFSEAAYDLFISQSSISKQIKSLEDELGVTLFKRCSYERSLTAAGEIYLKYALAMNNLHQNLMLELEQYKDSLSGTLRIGSIPVVSSYGISEYLAAFQNIYKNTPINFDIHETTQFDVLKELNSQEIDLALLRIDNITNLKDYDILLYSVDELVMICDKHHPLSKQAHVSLKDIAKYPLYLLSKKSTLNSLVANAFEKENIPYQQGGETSRHKILLDILSNSQNVSILPKALLDAKIYTELCYVPLESPIYSKVAIIRLKNHKYNKMTNTFWNFWRKHCTISEAQNKLEQRKKSLSS